MLREATSGMRGWEGGDSMVIAQQFLSLSFLSHLSSVCYLHVEYLPYHRVAPPPLILVFPLLFLLLLPSGVFCFLNTLSLRCHQRGWGPQVCPMVSCLESDVPGTRQPQPLLPETPVKLLLPAVGTHPVQKWTFTFCRLIDIQAKSCLWIIFSDLIYM